MIVGGNRNGEYIKWFGNRVLIDGVHHVLHRVHLSNTTMGEYYVKEGVPPGEIVRIEVCG
jgi:hypothetical protein